MLHKVTIPHMYSCRSTEWPFWFGFITPFAALYLFDWIMFVVILVSIIKAKHNSTLKSNDSNIKLFKRNLIIALSLAVVFGLGWGFGLLTTSSSIEGLTFTFQVIFSIFVGSQGVLLFLLHGVRNSDVRTLWIGWWMSLRSITSLSSVTSTIQHTLDLPHHNEGVLKKDSDVVVNVQDSLEEMVNIMSETDT